MPLSDNIRSWYDPWIRGHPQGTFWQSLERKAYLEACGLKTSILASESQKGEIEATALIIKDKGKWGTTWEIPRGPIWTNEAAAPVLLLSIEEMAKKEGVTALFMSPSTPLSLGGKWRPSTRHVYPEATRVIDLTKTEEEILSQMHQKGRYNIRVAEKAGVTVRHGTVDDIDTFYALLTETKDRDGFKISQKSHYSRFLSAVAGSFVLIAEHQGRPIAGLIGVTWPAGTEKKRGEDAGLAGPASGATPLREGWARGRDTVGGHPAIGIYYYGASSYENRALMAPYLLQWEAMKHCKAQNCHTYDLFGVSKDENAEPGEARTRSGVKDSWHGITDFKRKFGGTILTYPKEHVLVLRPMQKMIVDLKRKLLD